jgi:LuxR family maltose regulon positive regulatory protein
VSAPAGFGKTTAIAEWLSGTPDEMAVAWLSLDRRDRDAALFWTYVVTALQSAVPGVGRTALELLASSSPSADVMVAALVNDIDRLSTDVVLVLDDYHLVEAPDVHEGVGFLLEHQPARLHVVIATRVDPPFPLAQLRAQGRLIEVRASDLRFTSDEATAYLNGSMGLRLGPPDVARLAERTEGWIAALQLAALSLHGRADASAFIAGFAGDDRYIVDYLADEVLARQPPDLRAFLLRTSILERLTGPLCDAVTGLDGGRSRLLTLDDRRQWYRYHHLFADVLHAHLLDEHPDQVAGLHRRASAWFEAEGNISQAVTHAQGAGDHDRTADLMERAMPVMRRERREAELARWMRTLPDDVVRMRPVLDIAFVGGLVQAGEFESAGPRLDRVEIALRAPDGSWPEQPPSGVTVADEANYRALPAHIEMYRAALALAAGDLQATIAHARAALELAPADEPLARSAAGALAGLALWTLGDLAGAHAAYAESTAGLTRAGFHADVLGCTITLADIRRAQGRLTDALHTYQVALESAAASPSTEPLRGTADMHVGLAGLLLERNDLEGARRHLTAAQNLGEHNGLPQNPYRRRVVMSRLRAAEGDLDDALALLDEADRVYNGDFAPNVAPVPAVRARLRLLRGELAPAQEWAQQRQVSPDDEPNYLQEYEHLTVARLLMAEQRLSRDPNALAAAVTLLERLLVQAEQGGRTASVIETLILQALAYAAAGNAPGGLAALHRAVTLAQPEGYVRLFADEGPPMAAVLKALAKQPDAPPHVRRVLAATTTTAAPAHTPAELVDPLSERELDVLRLLGGDLGGPGIARELSVSLNTVRTHTKNIYAKLGVNSRRAAVRQARDLELIP